MHHVVPEGISPIGCMNAALLSYFLSCADFKGLSAEIFLPCLKGLIIISIINFMLLDVNIEITTIIIDLIILSLNKTINSFHFIIFKLLAIGIVFTLFACVIFPWMTLVAMLFVGITIVFMHFAQKGIQEVKRIEGSCESFKPLFMKSISKLFFLS